MRTHCTVFQDGRVGGVEMHRYIYIYIYTYNGGVEVHRYIYMYNGMLRMIWDGSKGRLKYFKDYD